MTKKKFASPLSLIIALTIIAIAGQIIFFVIHYKVSDLLDSFVQSTLKTEMFHAVILFPIIGFILIQIMSYCLFIAWNWFASTSISELFNLSQKMRFWLTIFIWFSCSAMVLSLNNYFFQDSFFAELIPISFYVLYISLFFFSFTALLAYVNCFLHKSHLITASLFLALVLVFCGFHFYNQYQSQLYPKSESSSSQPNIIFIGLDSVRPDFVNFYSKRKINTPHIDAFLNAATIFNEAYTPLARTFTSWMSILTSLHPKNSHARINLADPEGIKAEETLAKRLKGVGYETIYATDEKRFSNITERYGFDHIIGPDIGINDFVIGGLNDFPLTNLLIDTSLGRILFPYNYANRAAAITYDPENFLELVKLGLTNRTHKPLFLAIHFCISHWPYTWAQDNQPQNFTLPERYQSSVEAVDKQLGELLVILQKNKLLDHSIVVLLSDHGTTVGLLGDRTIAEKNYVGDRSKIKLVKVFKLSTTTQDNNAARENNFTINTSYGQGTDILSLKQYHILLAFKGFGIKTHPQQINERVSLVDIAPTILDFLNLSPFKKTDGFSLKGFLLNTSFPNLASRPLFLETGFSVSEIEKKDIHADKVIKQSIRIYALNPFTGQLFVPKASEKNVNRDKEYAILKGDWLLASLPESKRLRLALSSKNTLSKKLELTTETKPAYFVIANIRNGNWSIGLDSPIAKQAPLKDLLQQFKEFYGDEIKGVKS